MRKPYSRAYNRDVSRRKAQRKRRIVRQWYTWRTDDWEYYKNLHQYSKNKIHCSCSCCSPKTRNKGKRRQLSSNWLPSINYKPSDLRKQNAMDFDEQEYNTLLWELSQESFDAGSDETA